MTMYDKQSRLDKAFDIIAKGMISLESDGVYLVQDSTGKALKVDLKNQFHGNCPDFVYNCGALWEQPCKHILAAQMLKKTESHQIEVR